jgi:ribonuclease-3
LTRAGKWATENLGYQFQAPELLDQALTHRSLSVNNGKNNERLEFLGDAVLDLAIAAALYRDKEHVDEGQLSRRRAALVRRESLAEIAGEIGLGDLVRLGSGEARSGGHQRASILADAFEAVLGAIYLDAGYLAAEEVIARLFGDRLADLPAMDDLKDAKTTLQELLQAQGRELPEYQVIEESGPPHDRRFVVQCIVNELALDVTGIGSSRRRAEQEAAGIALNFIQQREDDAS